jgi:hypothetical protein
VEFHKAHVYFVSISDSDGEFLLVEAADALPAWATPETTEHRVRSTQPSYRGGGLCLTHCGQVYLYRGQLHLIAPPETPAELVVVPARVTPTSALRVLSGGRVRTVAPAAVQTALTARLSNLPGSAFER